MQFETSEEALFEFLDDLLARWNSKPKRFPFNKPSAIIPQTIIPEELRKDREALATFYVAIDNDMKGKVTSITAFKGYIEIWKKYPWFFDPRVLLWEKQSRVIEIYEEFLPIDKLAKTKALFINYRHLMQYYDSNALNLLRGVRNYDEALRRLLNKRSSKRELRVAGYAGEGLFGHQHKMVSMLVYFFDWEGWLKPRFIYPPPGDIQNFRGALSSGSIIPQGLNSDVIGNYKLIGEPWRRGTMKYIRVRKADPRDVADVAWLFGAEMCGNSPLTVSKRRPRGPKYKKEEKPKVELMFGDEDLPEVTDVRQFLQPKYRKDLEETCLICPILSRCNFAIPAGPYYDEGEIVLRPRPRVEDHIDRTHLREPTYTTPEPDNHRPLPFE